MAKSSGQEDERDSSGPKIGALLQASRKRLGEELADVATILRIRLPYLVAIEAGRYLELPGTTYAVGFIRAYAEHLGLDSEEVVRRFKAETIDNEGNRVLSFPTPVPETGIPGGAYVFVSFFIALLAYGAWYLSTTKDDLFAELVNPLDEQMTTLLYNDDMTNSELSKPDSGSDPVQVDTLVATAPELSDDKLIDPEKTELESVADAAQVDVLAVTKEAASFADTDMPGEGVPEGGVKPIVSILKTKPKPTPSLELKVRKSSVPSIEKLNAKKLDATSAKLAEVEKIISVGEKRSKTVVEIQPLPKAEPKLEEVSSDLFAVEALETETEMALPELLTEPEATATPAPIETAARGSSRIKINAINNSWIQIRDDNSNTMLVTRLLAAGDSFAVPDQLGLVLLTGNAGALEIVVDGTAVPSIGGPGVVRRGVILEVGRLKAGSAVSN